MLGNSVKHLLIGDTCDCWVGWNWRANLVNVYHCYCFVCFFLYLLLTKLCLLSLCFICLRKIHFKVLFQNFFRLDYVYTVVQKFCVPFSLLLFPYNEFQVLSTDETGDENLIHHYMLCYITYVDWVKFVDLKWSTGRIYGRTLSQPRSKPCKNIWTCESHSQCYFISLVRFIPAQSRNSGRPKGPWPSFSGN